MSTLGERLRDLRKEKTRKSQKEFGDIFGLSESAIGMYERNQRKPDYETLEKFAKYLETDVNYLITGEKVKNKNELPILTDKDEKDIAKKLESILNDLDSDTGLSFAGEPMNDVTRELIKAQIESNLRTAKQMAKKKFTPKKYRKDDE